ncbi:C4-dicarboxylate TRAP transporter substrate-binding protein [Jannaschia aquimarina]|uniref:DctP_2 protein n=1 Tax=Jannaschia aquimarina TaxID=935700 RepID=A0A0D1EJY0_9RHOB|nr:C4-dicarboxylate TRAP transporter substrate-binding protein [Jannaschia aquimarina]KIT17869.1 C4-dicarboxylate-binding periplasmic protein precursor [Jannaschia aquimarina]SNS55978.1 TRAP-type C4-dicarboxylate transport system, substrate-binding protein [Jannaschia aquimarina]
MRRLCTAAVALGLSVGAAWAQTNLILGEAGPNRGARAAALQHFVDTAEANADLQIDVQWGGALFKANAARQSISDGVADLGTIIGVYFPQEMVGYGIADLPLQNADPWVGMRATDELMRGSEAIQASLADQNLVYLGTFTTSAVNIGCKDAAIRSVADIEGLKVRGVGAYGKTFGDLGANMVAMSIYDAYQGLDTGLLDCSQGYSYAVAALKQQEVMTSYTLLDWGQVGALGIFMNKDVYDGLPDDVKTALNDAGVAMADKMGELVTADNEAAIETMRAAGVEIIELDAAERDALIERGRTYVDEWVENANDMGLDGAALLEEYRALLEKYEGLRDSQGYPWERS